MTIKEFITIVSGQLDAFSKTDRDDENHDYEAWCEAFDVFCFDQAIKGLG
jgi:hypothetical protein